MIANSPDNRKIILQYLDSISEDAFTAQFIIPLFSSYGFRVYRLSEHGPGEHGKDVVFVRYDPLKMCEEFVAVQVKAEVGNARNVSHFASQITRALKVGFPRVTGKGDVRPHHVFFMNARRHTNDATTECLQLVDDATHVSVFTQEHVCDLIMLTGVAPNALREKLVKAVATSGSPLNDRIYRVLIEDQPKDVDHLLDHEVKLQQEQVSDRMRRMIIEFAIKKWDDDPSWAGLERPMRWIDSYFEFVQPDQREKLLRVLQEYTASYSSHAASLYTHSIVSKLRPEHVAAMGEEFVRLVVDAVRWKRDRWNEVKKLASAARQAHVIQNRILDAALAYADERAKPKEGQDAAKLKALTKQIDAYLDPDVTDGSNDLNP